MINREATIRWKGYDPNDLKPHSRKRVWRVCDICERGIWVRFDGCSDVCNDCTCRLIAKRTKLNGSRVGANNPNYGKKASEETRRKMSVSLQGQKRTRIQKKHISESLTGRKLTDAHKLAMSITHTGKKLTDEHKKNIGLSKVGIPFSDEHKQKIGEANKNKVITLDTRQHISAGQQGIPYEEWTGFSKEQLYCEKFDDACRERIREKYRHRCYVCDKPQDENTTINGNVRKLSVHHIDMNKDQGCDGVLWKLVPLCMHCHPKAHYTPLKHRLEYLLHNDKYIYEELQ